METTALRQVGYCGGFDSARRLDAVGVADDQHVAEADEEAGLEDADDLFEPAFEAVGVVDPLRTGSR